MNSIPIAENPPFQKRIRRPRAWVTWLLVLSTVGMFVFQLLVFHLTGQDDVGEMLSFSPDALAEGRYWTLLTYGWAHAVIMFGDPGLFWLHLAANMVPLICLGPALEEALGHFRFLGLYLGGMIGAALGWYLFNLHSPEGMMGASGAVFALLTAAATVAPRARVTVYVFFILPIPMNMLVLALLACGLELAQLIFGWLPQIAHLGHLAGAVFGVFYILLLRLRSQPVDMD